MPAKKERIALVCAECGVTFELLACQLTGGRGKFCSRKCKGLARRHRSEVYCAMCDTPFERAIAEQDCGVKINQFCSRECYFEWRDVHRKPSTYPKAGGVHRHRIVAESVLNRPLAASEVVHHIDRNKWNFHPSNLAVFPDQSTHMRCHHGGMSDAELRGFSLVQAIEDYPQRV